MSRIIPTAIILILIGVIVGLNIQPTPNTFPSNLPKVQSSSDSEINIAQINTKINELQSRVNHLENSFNAEIDRHKITADQLTSLKLAMNSFKKEIHNASPTPPLSNNKSSENKPKPENTTLQRQLTQPERNKNILLSMGVDSENASRIQRLSEKKEMDQLYLRNTAVREGWFGTEKYFEKTRELDLKSNIYREELGDDKYDQFLYESQLTNRILIQSILAGSPAENAGLQSGDYILSYDNTRVFNWSDLTALTANGEPGESVPIEVERSSQTFQYFITRGPLGIRLNSERVKPEAS